MDKTAVLEQTIQDVLSLRGESQDPFYLVDLETIADKYVQWRQLLPMVTPFYAVKCNPNPEILRTLQRLGAGFDCASRDEIDQCLEMGVEPENLIFANPCKLDGMIVDAKLRNVRKMTFDNEEEAAKIARLFPEAELVLRIITDDSHSLCKFSSKFGALMQDVPSILRAASEHGAKVIGVSFHVGSGCEDPCAFAKAVRDARAVFEMGKEYGYEMNFLDLGGGWQGDERIKPLLRDVAEQIIPELELFPPGTQIISEPGRYFASKSHTVVVRIHSRRVMRDAAGKPTKVLYYVNDGVYQSFNCIFFDHQHPEPRVVPDARFPGQLDGPTVPSTVFGPTCDSLDCIVKDFDMPLLEIGQWLWFENMGAYTTAASTRFNGFTGAAPHCLYMWGPRFVESVGEYELPGLPARSASAPPIDDRKPLYV
jgi:ornithine decarboxylase